MSRNTTRRRPVVACLVILCALLGGIAGPWAVLPGAAALAQETTPTWRAIGPFGGQISALALSPAYSSDQTVFAASGGRLFRSVDGGSSWTQLSSFVGDTGGYFFINQVAVSPGYSSDRTLYVVNVGDFYRSTDGGASWQLLRDGGITAIQFSPAYGIDGEIVAASSQAKLLRSVDRGATWTPLTNGITSTSIQDVAYSPNYASDRTIFALGDGLFKSTNAGASWIRVAASSTVSGYSLVVSPRYGVDQTVFVAGNSTGIFRSRNGGITWGTVGSELGFTYAMGLNASPVVGQGYTLLATTRDKVWRSRDGGSTWSVLNLSLAGDELAAEDGALAISPAFATDNTIFGGSQSGAGVFRSINGGDSWVESNQGLKGNSTEIVRLSPNFASDGVILANGGSAIYRSADGGASWQRTATSAGGFRISDIEFSPSFASDRLAFFTDIGLRRSTDGGVSWGASVASTDEAAPAFTIDAAVTSVDVSPAFAADNTVFANRESFITADAGGLLRSNTRGASFTRLGPEVGDLALSPNFATDGIMIAVDREIKRSTTAGASWTTVFPFGANERFADLKPLALSPAFAQDGLALLGTPERLLRSTNSGASWTPIQQRAVWAIAFSPKYAEDKVVYFGLDDGVYRSTDAGTRWSLFAPAPAGQQINTLAVDPRDPSRLFIGTNAGVWSNAPSPCEQAGLPPAVVTITQLADAYGNNVYPLDTDPKTREGSVEGNTIQATVRVLNCGSSAIDGVVALSRGDGKETGTIPAQSSKDVTLTFPTEGLAWTAGQRAGNQNLSASFTPTGGTAVAAVPVEFSVRPRPVVLVHGYNDSQQLWLDYFGPTMLGSQNLKDIKAYTTPRINTGFNGSPTNTISQNAFELMKVVEQARNEQGAAQVDVVAHSMGGLITRRYLHEYAGGAPVRHLMMLGTPNKGSRAADILAISCLVYNGALLDRDFPEFPVLGRCRSPAILELTRASTLVFNLVNTNTRAATFSLVAGRYRCLQALPEAGNPLEVPFPNDIVVSSASAFGIGLNNKWLFPPEGEGCAGRHEWMTSNSTTQPLGGGQRIFDGYVKPLLTGGTLPAQTASLAETAPAQAAESLQAVQHTAVQTGTLQPGGRLEFRRPLEVGMDGTASFVVVGEPRHFTVSVRAPDGTLYTPASVDPAVTYMSMADGSFPLTSYTIRSTLAGEWTTIVEANGQTPAGGTAVAAIGQLQSDLRLAPLPPEQALVINKPVVVGMRLASANTPTTGATVTGLLSTPDGLASAIVLRDDGQNGDAAAGDGVYSYRFTPRVPGVYSAAVTATGLAAAPAGRSELWVAAVEGTLVRLPLVRR